MDVQKITKLVVGGLLACVWCLPANLWAHEVVGDVTPLMVHMKRALLLIENEKDAEAAKEIQSVYEDFSHEMGMGMTMQGAGLKTTASQIDQRFGTRLGASLAKALKKEDVHTFQRVLQELAFLLMLEKFEALRSTFENGSTNLEAQKTIFWLGRNYFSYLLEPTLAMKDPVEEQRLDRLLDRMLYRLEDRLPQEFITFQKELERGIVAAFKFDPPALMQTGSQRYQKEKKR
jgi:hypothetical protein